MSIARIRNVKHHHGIPSGTELIKNGAIVAPDLVSGSISVGISTNGNTSGASASTSFTISEKLIGRELSITLLGIVTYRAFSEQITYSGSLKNGVTDVASVNLLNVPAGQSTSTTVTYTPTSTTFTVSDVLIRTPNPYQQTQAEVSTVKVQTMTVL